ncbi:LpxI family protein [Desulfovibrio litoralis]|uniref:UDP-2,3-diacylglucosamine pyrophosphatase LpxI n=1 Tax=Desulfovibrio litoralis DSM 11393 TaxID=1121455 RepID=A0A1M7SNI2_9BACT|nr:UDP-2,3-diacylglucosamine diphosphatase LpxI [Desulfovibrio litoralis]SHN59984.1 hypothetical protein SAMN02745728_01072 [Desulfovibrio litoralis DSM 11393]
MDIFKQSPVVGIIAGGGQFPVLVARAAHARGLKVVMTGFVGHTDPLIAKEADAFKMIHLGQLTALVNFFKKHNVVNICMAGAVSKPKALDLRPDWRAAKALFNLARRGDNDLLSLVVRELEADNFLLFQAADLSPDLLAPVGILTANLPDHVLQEMQYAWSVLKGIGSYDIGQAIVVKERMVIAVEAIEGTDATIKRAAELVGEGCVLVKTLKPNQDGRTDLPALGLKTIELLTKYKYAGLGYEAGKSLFFDVQEAIRLAEKNKLSIVGIPSEGIENLTNYNQ